MMTANEPLVNVIREQTKLLVATISYIETQQEILDKVIEANKLILLKHAEHVAQLQQLQAQTNAEPRPDPDQGSTE
jgi:hypothetical protein